MTVAAGFFSLTSGPAGREDEYARWHLLDHQPEQYAIPGIRLGTRWRADEECVALRIAAHEELAPVRHAMGYLLTEPVEETLADFVHLGGRLRDAGRFPVAATSHLLGAFERTGTWSAASAGVTPEVIPFRPHRGVYLVIEQPPGDAAIADHWQGWHDAEHVPAVLDVDGVAGVCTFAAGSRLGTDARQGPRFGMPAWDPKGLTVSLIYLDGDVAGTAAQLAPHVRERWRGPDVIPWWAGPLRSTVAYEAWPAAT